MMWESVVGAAVAQVVMAERLKMVRAEAGGKGEYKRLQPTNCANCGAPLEATCSYCGTRLDANRLAASEGVMNAA